MNKLAVYFLVLFITSSCLVLAQSSKDIRSQIETGKTKINQIEAELKSEEIGDANLLVLKEKVSPVVEMIESIIQREQPKADDIKARLEQLGNVPDKSKGESESVEVTNNRTEQEQNFREVDDNLRLARAQILRIEQIREAIAEKRRQNFKREILAQSYSIFSTTLWIDAVSALPNDISIFNLLLQQWFVAVAEHIDIYKVLLLFAIVSSVVFLLPKTRMWIRTGSWNIKNIKEDDENLTDFNKALVALRVVLIAVIAPIAFSILFYRIMQSFGFLPGRTDALFAVITSQIAAIITMSGFAIAVFSPFSKQRRLFSLTDYVAKELWKMVRMVAYLVAFMKISDALQTSIFASLPIVVATKASFSFIIGLEIFRRSRRALKNSYEENNHNSNMLFVRLSVLIFSISLMLCDVGGYVALSVFLIDQVIWISTLIFMTYLTFIFIDEIVTKGCASTGFLGKKLREETGLTASSIDQFSVLGAGISRIIIYLIFVMLILAPWGIDSANIFDKLKAAFFGFQVGGVTISLASLAISLFFMLSGLLITKSIQNWLTVKYLPHTDIDPGIRNSINTIFGYIGVFVTIAFSLAQLGLSLDKITIVAGALSVGIGFGLQSIVNNFVSGLILLWERPIRVGDLIVVGEEQGVVKRINIRATEIQTFDRASVIIPNSSFISGRVKNWMYADRMTRISIPVSVDYSSEPERVQELLKEIALSHREVLSEPTPTVLFKNLGDNGMEFELRCFCDVDAGQKIRSDLLFEIIRRLKLEKIELASSTHRIEIANASQLMSGSSLENLKEGG